MAQNICTKCNRILSVNAVRCGVCGQYVTKNLVKFGFALLYVVIVTVVYYKWMRR